jgi:carbamoyl-phosphate synthase large subunit
MLKQKQRPAAKGQPCRPANVEPVEGELNVLLTCIGRRVSLLRAFRRAMATVGVRGKILGSDWSAMAPAFYEADEGFMVPGVNSPHYVDIILDLCRKQQVGLVIPLVDTELLTLSRARERFAEAGVRVLVSSPKVVEICRDKEKTSNFLISAGVGAARVLTPKEALKGPFPIIAKARAGSSTKNVRQIHHAGALGRLKDSKVDYVLEEFVEGREYTVDIYAGLDGVPRVAVPRERLQVRSGEVIRSVTVRDDRIISESLRLVEALGECVGVITAQCRVTRDNQVKFFDVNPRFGGGVPLTIQAGADFPRWIIEEHLGRKVAIDPASWQDGLVMMRYDAEVFRRLDELAQD